MNDRVGVRKTYKLYLGGAFPRSESGRTYEVNDGDGNFLANAVRASRKDVRDAVVAAHKAWPKWAGATAYNRGQVLYRIAEIMETRRPELVDEINRAGADDPDGEVARSVDLWVWYAGWADKIAQVMGNLNPVAGPYFNISAPEPTGIVGTIAPQQPALLGLTSRIAPALAGGNVVVALASESRPLPAIALSECMATADVPGGVVNVLTGSPSELVSVFASHMDIDVLDVTGVPESAIEEAEKLAANNVKRVVRDAGAPSPYEVTAFMETKTVWHPKGA